MFYSFAFINENDPQIVNDKLIMNFDMCEVYSIWLQPWNDVSFAL